MSLATDYSNDKAMELAVSAVSGKVASDSGEAVEVMYEAGRLLYDFAPRAESYDWKDGERLAP